MNMSRDERQLDFDLDRGRAARDDGIAQTTENNASWHDRALVILEPLRGSHREMTGEDIRVYLIANGLEAPDSPHAYGALVKSGLLWDTGRQRQMAQVKSHARRTPIWKFLWG
jgi:hypothetical protein